MSHHLIDTNSCKIAVELLGHLVTKVEDKSLIKNVAEIVGFNLGGVAIKLSLRGDVEASGSGANEEVCRNIASIKEKIDELIRPAKT